MDRMVLLKNLGSAVLQLEEALRCPPDNDIVKAGCIQYFEFCFELAWKSVKQVAEGEGMLECSSPKAALKCAFKSGWLAEEDVWLEMLSARNRMSHTYCAADALEVFVQLPRFLAALCQLHTELSRISSARKSLS